MAPANSDDNTKPPYDPILVSIAQYVYHYEITSAHAMAVARLALLDALGCAMETITSGECAPLIGPVVKNCTTHNGFRLPGTAYELDPVKGAFDLGILIRYLDHNDGFTGAEWGHPSGMFPFHVFWLHVTLRSVSDNIGAILAVADYLSRNPSEASSSAPPLTLDTIFIAIIKAYEIQGCLQLANTFNAVGLDHVILVKVASTAISSWLLGLSESQAVDAISQAWIDGHPLRIYRHAPNAGPRKGWAGGDACMRAVHLALLTRAGQTGTPSALSTPRWGFCDALFRGKGIMLAREFASWVIENIFFKIVPAEGHALSAIEAMLMIRRHLIAKGADLVEEIIKINVRTHAGVCLIINKSGLLHNMADRDHCMQYILAVTLLKGDSPEYADYRDDSVWAVDQRVSDLRAKIELFEDKKFSDDYVNPDKRSMASALKVKLKDGSETEEVIVEYPLGNPRNSGTTEAVRIKIEKNLGLMFAHEEVAEILNAVQHRGNMSVRGFVDLLWKGGGETS